MVGKPDLSGPASATNHYCPVVVGADWLVVVADFGVPEGVDWAFWADGVELGEEAVGDAAGEFELV